MKFGGTSVGSPASINNLKTIVEQQTDDCIVVVSALGGITDQLIRAAHLALQPEGAYEELYDAIVNRHHDMIAAVIASEKQPQLLSEVDALLRELATILLGVRLVRDLSAKSLAAIVSYGERISSRIVTALIPGAVRANSCAFIKTQGSDPYTLCSDLTSELVKEAFKERKHVVVCPGFIATDSLTGEITNLGRGGSDYTAAILAAELDAEVLEIWTDVDGFMTADPRLIPAANTISELSYQEATELCNFGAKVVYPPTIYPVCAKNIPIRVFNTWHPDNVGTVIAADVAQGERPIRGISSIRNVALLTVSGLSMVGVIGVNRRIFSALAEAHISVFLVCQASSENSTSLGIQEKDCDEAVNVLNREFEEEIRIGKLNPMTAVKGLAAAAIVGEKMCQSTESAGKLFRTLSRENIRVIAFAQGALGMNISFIVEEKELEKTMHALHESYFSGGKHVLNIFLAGVGTVGGALLDQIAHQQQLLLDQHKIALRVVGIARSRQALICPNGIDLKDWRGQLASAPELDITSFTAQLLQLGLPKSVFVDCTASAEVAARYADLLQSGINVVAANKIAASANDALRLNKAALLGGAQFLHETNVGAGLPIIRTIRDMVLSGDRITRIDAVLSGTLNFVCNRLAEGEKISVAVREAKEKGYSEPDPRIDLSGDDVCKKVVILAREAGWQINKEDVRIEPFLKNNQEDSENAAGETVTEASENAFGQSLQSQDAQWAERVEELRQTGKVLRYVGSITEDGATVSLVAVDASHPFYRLADTENCVMICSVRYPLPLIIRGYGAGADVTAAGVFSDLLALV